MISDFGVSFWGKEVIKKNGLAKPDINLQNVTI